jgi:hypothetical protein
VLNLKKLKKVVQKDGKIEAQCPACAAAGADSTGNHLVVYPNGKYGCVANPDDEHSKVIFKLVGQRDGAVSHQLAIRRLEIGESRVLMKIGHLGRQKPTPVGNGGEEIPAQQNAVEVATERPCGPAVDMPPVEPEAPGEITTEMARRFLAEP